MGAGVSGAARGRPLASSGPRRLRAPACPGIHAHQAPRAIPEDSPRRFIAEHAPQGHHRPSAGATSSRTGATSATGSPGRFRVGSFTSTNRRAYSPVPAGRAGRSRRRSPMYSCRSASRSWRASSRAGRGGAMRRRSWEIDASLYRSTAVILASGRRCARAPYS